jgi:signal transduction histidine kinase
MEARSIANGTVTVAVRDEGPGIDPEQIPHLFGRFRSGGKKPGRGIDGHGQETEGNGLGLAIRHSILAAHRGSNQTSQDPRLGLF